MPAKPSSAPPRGMRDLLPDEVELRDRATATILDTYRRFGFSRVETPALESIELLSGSGGGENEKLIFKVLKRGEKLDLAAARSPEQLVDLGLRYDLTVPLARYYARHQAELPQPFKSIQIGPVWRAERPQKGRYRQFTQCDIDVLGEAGPLAEADLIAATAAALAALGLERFVVRLNDRRLLVALATGCGFAPEAVPAVLITVDKLDKLGLDGVRAELAGAGHPAAAVGALCALLEGHPRDEAAFARLEPVVGRDAEAAAGRAHLAQVIAALGGSLPGGARLVFDPTLVRGMGYYTGPIFEVGQEGLSYSLAGGGRYDRMIGRMLGRDVPACGFSIGFERIVLVLAEQGLTGGASRPRLALLFRETDALAEVLAQAAALRAAEADVSVLAARRNRRQQLDELARAGFSGYADVASGRDPEVRPLGEA